MKRRGLIFNSRPDKAAMFALGLMLGLCPVSQAWADTNITDSQVVAQAQKKVKGQVIDATGEPLIGVNISVIGGTEGTITDIDGNYAINVPAGAKLKFSYIGVGSALGALPHFCGRFPRACPRTVLTCLHVHGSPL